MYESLCDGRDGLANYHFDLQVLDALKRSGGVTPSAALSALGLGKDRYQDVLYALRRLEKLGKLRQSHKLSQCWEVQDES